MEKKKNWRDFTTGLTNLFESDSHTRGYQNTSPSQNNFSALIIVLLMIFIYIKSLTTHVHFLVMFIISKV